MKMSANTEREDAITQRKGDDLTTPPPSIANETVQPVECERLTEFKNFLQQLASVLNKGNDEAVEIRSCVTRSNNETYPVTIEELQAEVTMAIWKYLQEKSCPADFIMPLLHALESDIANKCRNAKAADFVITLPKEVEQGGQLVDVDAPQFDLVKLQKFIKKELEKFLSGLTDNAELGNLHNYAEANSLCARSCSCSGASRGSSAVQHVVGFTKNKPRKMEDRHVILERFSDLYQLRNKYSFYGVFDGHSGSLAAQYCTCQLPELLAKHLKELESQDCSLNESFDYREAFESSFLEVDKRFCQKSLFSGTTAVCALVSLHNAKAMRLTIAWVGDSKALLVSPLVSLQLVKPHRPDCPEERKRIEEPTTGGRVIYAQGHWRVNGILNVSRSIGDYSVTAAIAEPDIVDLDVMPDHDFLILATDGLWDHVPEKVVTEAVYEALHKEQHIKDIPKQLIELAKQGDSQDNITVVIIFLKERSAILENYDKWTSKG